MDNEFENNEHIEPTDQQEIENTLTDIDSLDKFTFQGQEYTPDQLHDYLNGYNELKETHSKVTEESKYLENLRADLDHVRQRPELVEKFKQTYPQKYHSYLDLVLKKDAQAQANGQEKPSLPEDVMKKLSEIDEIKGKLTSYEQREREAEAARINSELDQTFNKLSEKYPFGVEADVLAKAEAMIQRGHKFTNSTWERLWRESNNTFQKRWESHHDAIVKAQAEKGKKAGDIGPGGQAPGQEKNEPRTLQEATKSLLSSF